MNIKVKAWTEQVTIPTYGIGKPEKNPMFLEKRVYQGSSGVVYPHPVIEKIQDEKHDKTYTAVFLENDYLKIMILPEIGGRVQMAWDKSKKRHFVYYNQVIKPALVGLTGPWISGGIEFNWPQHHRPSTFEPTDYCIENQSDGSVTVWCNEVERMFRTRGMAGFTLYPDKAFLEIKVKLYNRTLFPQTFLWWANPAVKVNDHYQSVFPPDVYAVFDHGKRDVSEFPIARGTYYKVDYSPGTDISRYKNIPVPTSYMAITSEYDFVGGYENDVQGGLLHVANHHVSPGKKQWTWGNGDFGIAWDRNLTDEDGPYIELMCGVYTDNQPDFTWLMPGEEKSFSQYFIPYRDLGVVKCATREAMVNLEFTRDQVEIRAFATSVYTGSRIILKKKNTILLDTVFDFSPSVSFHLIIPLSGQISAEDYHLQVMDASGKILVSYQPEQKREIAIPESAKAAKKPVEVENNEQLYLTGLHIEQYRHATYDPRPYYEEALSRDPGDYRCNNALGLWYLRSGQFTKAEGYFETAIRTLTQRNPNPYDGEPLYNLGLALCFQQRFDEAYKYFYKSVWNAAWIDSGYFQLARIDTMKSNWNEALDHIERSLIRNWNNHRARVLKVCILRHQGRIEEALDLCGESLLIDPFNFSLYFERFLLTDDRAHLDELQVLIRGNIHNYIEFSLDYAWAGLYKEAIDLIGLGIKGQGENTVYPMAFYFKAWFENLEGKEKTSRESLAAARNQSPDYCFPNQTEAVPVLEWAISVEPNDDKACYYLGNYWYARRNYEKAIECWENAVLVNDRFPTTHRNLALAYFNKRHDHIAAVKMLEKAFILDQKDARVLMELDQLHKRLNYLPEERLGNLLENLELVNERDDLYLELAALYNLTDFPEKAYEMIMNRKFHPWEGGEGKVIGQYVHSLVEMAKKAITGKEFDYALELLQKAQVYPENLGEGKLFGARENEIHYWMGIVYQGQNQEEKAILSLSEASRGPSELAAAMFYNDQQPDITFYQGLAFRKLGKENEAILCFEKLLEFGSHHKDDQIEIDYFAVSLPDLLIWEDDLDKRNNLLCRYLMGLGLMGLNRRNEAIELFRNVLEEDRYHIKAAKHLAMAEEFSSEPIKKSHH
jgi:tetratricopeptide (TPR) repeat protein